MAKNPTVVAITGAEVFIQRRALLKAIDVQRKAGWSLDYIDGSESKVVEIAVGSAGCFLEVSRTLVIVSNPEKVKLSVLEGHAKRGDPNVVLLLDYPKDPKATTKFAKFLQGLGKRAVQSYPIPAKAYQKAEAAQRFVRQEAKDRGMTLPEDLAEAIVARLGQDLGFLSFEILKVSTLAEAEGVTDITASLVKQSMAPLTLTDVTVLADTVLARDPLQVANVLRRLRQSGSGDPTISVAVQLGKIVVRWLNYVLLRDAGKSPDEISGMTGMNQWVLKNKLLPPLRRWSAKDLVALIGSLAEAQRLQLSGALSPWTSLCAGVLSVCSGAQ